MQMPQLIRISHDIDGDDLSALYVERGRLKFAIGFEGNKTRQPVHERNANETGTEQARQSLEQLRDRIKPKDRFSGSWALAAAIGMQTDVSRQQVPERLHVATARCGAKMLPARARQCGGPSSSG